MASGASQVADSSTATDSMRTRQIYANEKPTDSRYVTIWPAKLSTVRHSS